MAMSDTCYEALGDLSRGVMHYVYLGYDVQDLSIVVDSMYGLARFGILQDCFERPAEDWIEKAANKIVLGHLIEDIESESEDAACMCVAGITKHNARLSEGINAFVQSAAEKNALFDAIAEPVMYGRLKKIAAYKDAA